MAYILSSQLFDAVECRPFQRTELYIRVSEPRVSAPIAVNEMRTPEGVQMPLPSSAVVTPTT
jgi:hypothetical protein